MFQIIIAVLLGIFGLRLLSSPLFNSLLSVRLDTLDYRVLPGIFAGLFCTVIVAVKILATSRLRDPDPPQERKPNGEGERIIRQQRPDEGGYRRPQ